MSYEELHRDELHRDEQSVAILAAPLIKGSSRLKRHLLFAVLVVAAVLGVAAACAQEPASNSVSGKLNGPIALLPHMGALHADADAPAPPWKPPPFTERKSVGWNAAFDLHVKTFGDAYEQLTNSLRSTDSDPSVFVLQDEGFVLVTRRQLESNEIGTVGRSVTIALTRHEPPPQTLQSYVTKHQVVGGSLPEKIARLKATASTKVQIFFYEHRYERSLDGSAWMLLKSSEMPVNRYLRQLNLDKLAAEGS